MCKAPDVVESKDKHYRLKVVMTHFMVNLQVPFLNLAFCYIVCLLECMPV